MIRINSSLATFEAGVRFKTNDLSFRAGWRIERIETRRVDAVIPRPKRSRIGGVREEKSEEGWPVESGEAWRCDLGGAAPTRRDWKLNEHESSNFDFFQGNR